MTAKIKLNAASGGGSFSLQAPSSSSNNRVMTLPDTADGTILTTTNPKSGNIIQVVSTTKTDTASTSTQGTFVDITGLSVAITPTQNDSKMFIQVKLNYGGGENSYVAFKLFRDSTAIGVSTYGTGNHVQSSFGAKVSALTNAEFSLFNAGNDFLDNRPNGTSQITYKVQFTYTAGGSPLYINRPKNSLNFASIIGGTSTITVMEVAA